MIFNRTIELIGDEKLQKLKDSTVLVLGLGGVGGSACEALARAGVGTLVIVDEDVVDITNINRQIVALHSTIGLPKTEVMKQRINDINPDCIVHAYHTFYDKNTKVEILDREFDFFCDCIDTLTYKIDLIKDAHDRNIKIISSMGMGNKVHPEMIEIVDIRETSHDPIARRMRSSLRKLKIYTPVPVVYSPEEPQRIDKEKRTPSSISYLPPVAGMIMASYVVNNIIE